MTNPFAAHVPAEQAAPQQHPAPAAGNPFAQQQAAPQQAPAGQQSVGNPFAQAAPQQYAPPAPQQQAPQYAPQQQAPQYAPQQQYAAPAPQQAPQAAPLPQFGQVQRAAAPVVGSAGGATVHHMYGRLLLIFPYSVETVPRKPEHITAEQRAAGNVNQRRMTATVVVLDSGPGRMEPIGTNGKLNAFPPEPPTEYAPLPYVRKAMWITQSRLIQQCEPSLPAGPGAVPGMVLGRLTKAGPQQNDPWYLDPNPTDADMKLCHDYLGLVGQGQYPNPLA